MKLRNRAFRMQTFVLTLALLTIGMASAQAQFPFQQQKPKGPWMDKTLSPDQRADLVIAQMTLDEKISLLHGGGWAELFALFAPAGTAPATRSLGNAGFIPGIPRLGIPDLQMADAAVGVTHGSAFGRYCTALPSGVSEASTWDLAMAREYGALIGRELRDQGYTMSLGGGVNLTREPRNGRIFEYKGEDPILAGKLVGAEMKVAPGTRGHRRHEALCHERPGERPQLRQHQGGPARHARKRSAGL